MYLFSFSITNNIHICYLLLCAIYGRTYEKAFHNAVYYYTMEKLVKSYCCSLIGAWFTFHLFQSNAGLVISGGRYYLY